MVINPGTSIYLLKDVPLDDTFDHTLYWDNTQAGKDAQIDWFLGNTNGFVKHQLLNQTYQRVEKGECMVEVLADNAYDCNYMLFKNASFGNKWFFCFIQDVEYINNKTSRIKFKIDVMQTWYFDYDLIPCFVERQHVEYDVLGENIQDEQIETGPYWQREIYEVPLGENYIVVCGTVKPKDGVTQKWTENDVEMYHGGGQYSGVYSACIYNVFKYPTSVNEFIQACASANIEPGIVNVFMAPSKFFGYEPIDANRQSENDSPYSETDHGFVGGLRGTGGFSGGSLTVDCPAETLTTQVTLPTTIGNYRPRNHKLFCWPYCMLTVTNNNGVSADYRHEFFTPQGQYLVFKVVLALSANPEACIYPMHYNHVQENFMEKIVINDFPQCSYAVDSYKAWLAQHRYTILGGLVTDVTTMAAGVALAGATGGAALGATVHGFNSVWGKLAQMKQASTMPPHAKGQQTNTLMTAMDRQGFHIYRTSVTDYYAELIDGYFSRFGYVCNRIVIPNRNVRPYFTFCKTRNCDINPKGMPDKYVKQIKEIYDNGIAFWANHNKDNIGQYTQTVFDLNEAPHVRPVQP